MTRLVAAAAALALGMLPPLIAPVPLVAAVAALGLGLAALAVLSLRRGPATAAACVFLSAYALALWLAEPAIGVLGATAEGLAVLALLHPLELARAARRAVVDARVVRSQALGWLALAAGALGAAAVIAVLAGGLASSVPLAAAPLLAAAGALGVVLGLTTALLRRTRAL